jgi:ADP-ribosyl-[dinitrogen reductase] hydrolase
MALCLANSLVVKSGYSPYDQLVRYKWWYRNGYMSSTGQCFDIGAATSQSLIEFERRQLLLTKKYDVSQEEIDNLSDENLLQEFNVYCSEIGVAGNGALMRLAPVPLFFYRSPEHAVEYSGRSGQITHGDTKAYDACRYYGALIVAALRGYKKDQLLDKQFYSKHKQWFLGKPLCNEIKLIAEGSYQKKGGYKDGIRGKGYIVDALEAALWAFWSDDNSFEKGALAAVNLGDDTDTTAAIYGQLAGAHYGYKKLPSKWLKHVYAKQFMLNLSKWITYEGQKWQPSEDIHPVNPSSPSKLLTDKTNTGASAHQPYFNMHSSPNEAFVPGYNSSALPETNPHRTNLRATQSVASTGQSIVASNSNTDLGPNNRSKMNSQFTHQLQPDEMVPEVPVNKPRSNLNLPPNNEPVGLINTFVNSGKTSVDHDQHRPALRNTISMPPRNQLNLSMTTTVDQRPVDQADTSSKLVHEPSTQEKVRKKPRKVTDSSGPPLQSPGLVDQSTTNKSRRLKPSKTDRYQTDTLSPHQESSTTGTDGAFPLPTTYHLSAEQTAKYSDPSSQPKFDGYDPENDLGTPTKSHSYSSNSATTSSTKPPGRSSRNPRSHRNQQSEEESFL